MNQNCKVQGGYASLRNGPKGAKRPHSNPLAIHPNHENSLESFFLAETLKYLYLLFEDDSVIPLEKYVFNTEAHPFSIGGKYAGNK